LWEFGTGWGGEVVRILLTTRRELAERRNPIALLDLAAYLRQFGHAVDCYYIDQIEAHKNTGRPYDIVGLSVLQTLNENAPVRDALYLKRTFRREVVVGGKWTQTMDEKQKTILTQNGIQVWTGPGERYFVDQEVNISSYPSWDRADFESLNDVRADIMSTRGCPYHCHFCHNTETKISFFSPARTANNIELLLKLGAKQLFFCDDIFTLRISHMAELYNELKRRGLDIEGRAEFFTHVNHINPEMIGWIKRYHPFRINIGVESGDDTMLSLMGKGFDSETAFKKIKLLYEETGLSLGTLFIIGYPGETKESMQSTLEFIRNIRPFAGSWVSYYQPVRGTKGYEMALLRAKKSKTGRRNNTITYVDPNLSKRLLFKYQHMMMDHTPDPSVRKRLLDLLIDVLPCWMLLFFRQLRQTRHLSGLMDSYLGMATHEERKATT
jgi:radical SAM superfamily enzyme YgiQ (UPF0313 family)